MTNAEQKRNIWDSLSCFTTSYSTLENLAFVFWKPREHVCLEKNSNIGLNTFYIHATTVPIHNAYFLYECLFCIFHNTKQGLAVTKHICILPSNFAASVIFLLSFRKITFSSACLIFASECTTKRFMLHICSSMFYMEDRLVNI